MPSEYRNSLKNETSPYLQQHADNPVEWFPWTEYALEKARQENRPILLSIGYSACHWCHVMAHESFEDPETAEVMNELFVNIKVDREERPDLDKIYQLAHQMLTQRPGGWPLTLFLSPYDHVPFFAGTYFPKQPKYQMPAFISILKQTAEYFQQHKKSLGQHNQGFLNAIGSLSSHGDPTRADEALLAQARNELRQSFDPSNGGFGQAPKFPHCSNMDFLLRYWYRSEHADSEALRMSMITLTKMAQGGIYDQLGGGFYRYSVDDYWLIPHFEKMLYDNGPLLGLYSQVWQIANDRLFEAAAIGTAEWVMREMQCEEGGYFSSLDADSEGAEGKFYVWTPDEVRKLVTMEELHIIEKHFGLDRSPNFEKHWHFHIAKTLENVADGLDISVPEAEKRLISARKKLWLKRESRVYPGRDEKILTSWNALMIRGMAIAARVFQREDFAASAFKSMDFIKANLWTGSRLLATYKDGKAHLNAYLDDYAYMIDACLELLQSRWRSSDLTWAMQLADVLLERYEDAENGGFFFTAHDHERLIHRPKPMMDESLPAGNGIAALALARLGHLIGNTDYLNASERVFDACAASMKRVAHAHGSMLIALDEQLEPPTIVVIRGKERSSWQRALMKSYQPDTQCFSISDAEDSLPGVLNDRKPGDTTVAYACTGTACLPAFTEYPSLEKALSVST